jgi:hypothetical protein
MLILLASNNMRLVAGVRSTWAHFQCFMPLMAGHDVINSGPQIFDTCRLWEKAAVTTWALFSVPCPEPIAPPATRVDLRT